MHNKGHGPAARNQAPMAMVAKKSPLTRKELAQRRYAALMKGVRARAHAAHGGTGRIRTRRAATDLRRKFHLDG